MNTTTKSENAVELNQNSNECPDRESIRKGLIEAGIAESRIETSQVGCLGYSFDVGPISLTPPGGVRGDEPLGCGKGRALCP